MLLATLTVNSVNDDLNGGDGLVTLREAVRAANLNIATDLGQTGAAGLDNIVFQAGLTGTHFLFAGDLDITENLTITGNGNTVIDGTDNFRIFDISAAPTAVTLDRLTLQNGQVTGAEDGGAIKSSQGPGGLLTIRNSTLTGNDALGAGGNGGAVYMRNGAVVIEDSTLTGNTAGGDGGAVYVFSVGDLTLTRCTLSGNTAGVFGGATYTHGSAATTMLTDSTLSGNTAGDDGGAIVARSSSSVVVVRSTLSGNHTTGNGAHGGAVSVDGELNVSYSTLSGNYTLGNNCYGGAISSSASGNITVVNSTLSGNQVRGPGTSLGGAIHFNGGDVTLVHSTITENSAGSGGGLRHFAAGTASLTIINSIVAGNTTSTGTDTDFFAPPTLTVRASLIGRSDGTTMTPDSTAAVTNSVQTASFVGGGTVGSGLTFSQIGLAPLTDNSGPTQTHALLSTSLALNSGFNSRATIDGGIFSAELANDQRGAPFHRVFGTGPFGGVDMGAYEAQALVSIVGSEANFVGTGVSDDFTVNLATATVVVNGVTYLLPSTINEVQIDAQGDNGMGGIDRLTVTGTAGAELVRMLRTEWFLDSSSVGFTGYAESVESITYAGNGGADVVTLFGSSGIDKFVGRATLAFLEGTGFRNTFLGSATVVANSTPGGSDTAYLFDNAAANTFAANGSTASMSGTGITATAFETVVGYASGGIDQANLTGSAVHDVLLARTTITTLTGNGIVLGASGFERVVANGGAGADVARLFGRNNVDTFTAGPETATLRGTGYQYTVGGFSTVIAAAAGPGDLVVFQDSTGNDLFIGRGNTGTLNTPTTSFSAENFSQITIRGTNGGTNRRSLTPPLGFTLVEQGTWV